MELNDEGFLRPVGARAGDHSEARTFRAMCPGVGVTARHGADLKEDPVFGLYFSAWQGWASDPAIRDLGSSGGVLTALNEFLRSTERRTIVATVASEPSPSRSVPIKLMTRAEVEASAGSRYAPVSNLEALGDATAKDVLVGKPCEVAAVRQAKDAMGASGETPLLLSFFCAGTPSQHATDRLVAKLGVDIEAVNRLRYRGNGWPGEFTVSDKHGREGRLSYHDSWGGHLGRDLQWRCKLCPHGTGDHADIAVGDFWNTDDHGYPLFESGAGNSVVIARTRRGHDLLLQARQAGVLVLSDIDLRDVQRVQPLQAKRIATLWGRLCARVLAGYRIPLYRGFHLSSRAFRSPLLIARTIAGTWLRAVRQKRPGSKPKGGQR